jgi:hypothetical protein
VIVITGDTRSTKVIEKLKEAKMGRMVIDRKIDPYLYEPWAFDNGAYRDFLRKQPFDELAFMKRMEMANSIGLPYMAVVPDIVMGGLKSLEYSMNWVDKMPYDWQLYLAVQDGMTEADIEPVLYKFDGIFLGGSSKFKATGPYWCELAHNSNKKFHYGRAGTLRKLKHAKDCNSDSCDSAFPLWNINRLDNFIDEYINS